jgi:hypothetical protein
MSISMREVDDFIDTTISRLSSEDGTTRSNFYIDLRSYQKRVTQSLIDECVNTCATRGLATERQGDGLIVTVNLHNCYFNPSQAKAYQIALNYTRNVYGNHL